MQWFFYPYYRCKVASWLRGRKVDPDPFLDQAKNLIHIGAHQGQERFEYAQKKLRVLWLEANPAQIPLLCANLRGFPRQMWLQALVGEAEHPSVPFYLSSNAGASSSVFPFDRHQDIWPEITMLKKIYLPQTTLPKILAGKRFRNIQFDTLVMDVQGSEMGILRSIPDLPRQFQRIQLETSDFSLYQGAPLNHEIHAYLSCRGFRLVGLKKYASDGLGKNCMDCRYELDPRSVETLHAET